jgi:M6 family metalloprotease-like protein
VKFVWVRLWERDTRIRGHTPTHRFLTQSSGVALFFTVTFDVQEWFDAPQPESYYAGGVSGFKGADASQELFHDALNAVYASGYDFATLDSAGYGTLDHLVAVHSGYGAEFGPPLGTEGCFIPSEKDRVWSKGYPAALSGWQSPDYLYTVSNYAFAGALDPPFCAFKPANMGVLTHEYMHGFGLIDLYDQDADEETIYLGGVGRYDIMSSTWGWNRNIAIPGHMSPFSRAAVGWIEPIEITKNGKYAVQAGEFSNQAYIIRKNFPAGEYLIIENRQPVLWYVQVCMDANSCNHPCASLAVAHNRSFSFWSRCSQGQGLADGRIGHLSRGRIGAPTNATGISGTCELARRALPSIGRASGRQVQYRKRGERGRQERFLAAKHDAQIGGTVAKYGFVSRGSLETNGH